MYDISHDETVSKQELSTLLNHVPKDVLHNFSYSSINNLSSPTQASSGGEATGGSNDSDQSSNNIQHDIEFEEVDNYTNHDMVERAFAECDLNHEGMYILIYTLTVNTTLTHVHLSLTQ